MKLIKKCRRNTYHMTKNIFDIIEKYLRQEKILYNCITIHNYCIVSFEKNLYIQNKLKKLTYNDNVDDLCKELSIINLKSDDINIIELLEKIKIN
jgi:hypothetical protein